MVVFLLLIWLLPWSAYAGYWEARHGLSGEAPLNSFWPLTARDPGASAVEIEGAWGAISSREAAARSKEAPLTWRNSRPSHPESLFLNAKIPFTPASLYYSQSSLGWNYWAHRPMYVKGSVNGWRKFSSTEDLRLREMGLGWSFFGVLELLLGLKRYQGARVYRLSQENSAGTIVSDSQEEVHSRSRAVSGVLSARAFENWKFSICRDTSASLVLPESWGLGIARFQEDGFIMGEILWRRYSRMFNPAFHDTLGFKFGFKAPIARRVSVYMGSQLSSHSVDRRLVEPSFSLGFGWKPLKRLEWKTGAFLSLRDYFGDGVFWPADQRVVEVKSGFTSMLTWKI